MYKRISLVAIVAALLSIVVLGAPAQAVSYHGMKVITHESCWDEAKENASKLQIWKCDGGPEQYYYDTYSSVTNQTAFHNKGTLRCVTAPAVGTGTVTMVDCPDESAATQHWIPWHRGFISGYGNYTIWQNASSGYCLATPNLTQGSRIVTATCNTDNPYEWWLEG